MATHLSKLRIEELSGVDEAANELQGWVMRKAKNGLKKELQRVEGDVVALFKSLTNESATVYLADAPDEIKEAREVLAKHIGEGLDDDADEEPTQKSVGDRLKELFGPTEPVTKAEESEDEAEDGDAEEDAGEPAESTPEDPPEEPEDPAANPDAEPPAEDPPASDVTQEAPQESEGEEPYDGSEEPVQAPDGKEGEPSDLVKSITGAVEAQLDPIRDAIVSLADRTEGLEKRSATRAGLDGQEFVDDPNAPAEGGLAKAMRAASKGRMVELT